MLAGPGLLWGLAAAALVSVAAHRAGALTLGGAAAATAVGGIVFGWGGVQAALPLLFFFVTGTALSRWQQGRKVHRLEHNDHKGRRAGQVLANGAVAALAIGGGALWPGPEWWAAFGGAIAAATADTWATEFGVLAGRAYLITTGAPAPPGRSGAVSGQGTAAGALGATSVAALVAAIGALGGNPFDLALAWPSAWQAVAAAAAAGGICGMVVDSLLGATVQERFFCPACGRETEARLHRCGTRTERLGGWPGVNNDVVNFCATLAGALAAAFLYQVLA